MLPNHLIIIARGEIAQSLRASLVRQGISSEVAETWNDAELLLGAAATQFIFVERTFVSQLLQSRPDVLFAVVGEDNTSSAMIEMIKAGAIDYLGYPFDVQQLSRVLDEGGKLLNQPIPRPGESLKPAHNRSRLIGSSPSMQAVYRQIGQLAPRDISVLLSGESGTGKEVVAHSIQEHSPRASAPFLAVNCAAIPESLLESEMFGHEKGSFTGATSRRIGKFEQADGGTLFLDEVGDMPLAIQAKFLRVLQDKTFFRVGGAKEISVNVRVIAATNRSLEAMVAAKQFREDLLYRLKVTSIHLPALRDREVDAVLLAHYFVEKFNPLMSTRIVGFDAESVGSLLSYSWPGNVRELENVIKASLVRARGTIFRKEFFPPEIQLQMLGKTRSNIEEKKDLSPDPIKNWVSKLLSEQSYDGVVYRMAIEELEEQLFRESLVRTQGALSETARLLGISRTTLRQKIKQYRIQLQTSIKSS
ncbi:MAG: sigma-54 dependent transcriptional regulator [Candidatus Sumerlaeia bacterium]|nr:sigma-54 dependent transcriptional regulator [Candidatus Sumerlaeia bacterium]